MELGPEDVSLLERCPHFRGCYVQASMELGHEDVSLLERCPHFRGHSLHNLLQKKSRLRGSSNPSEPSQLDIQKVGGTSMKGESADGVGGGGGGVGGGVREGPNQKKMQKVNPAAMLGFTVNAGERLILNMGEIQSVKDAV